MLHLHQINPNQINDEILFIKNKKSNGLIVIGIEVPITNLIELFDISIDPQHNSKTHNITSIEHVFENREVFRKYIEKNILILTLKTDIDSIGAMSILYLIMNNKLNITGDFILRMKAIAISDTHGRKELNTSFIKVEKYSKYGLPNSLLTMVSDRNLDITEKVFNMVDYLNNGTFSKIDMYDQISQEKMKRAKKNTKIEVINDKIVYIESTYRGALGLGYSITPIVFAKNDRYEFGFGNNKKIGTKFTIGQYDQGFIDLDSVLKRLNQLENGWGGSLTIIGSPVDRPSNLNKDLIIQVLKNEYK